MTLETILDKDMYDRYERNFLNSVRSQLTRNNYIWCFTKYKEFVGETRIIITHDNGPKIIESQIIDFLLSLKAKGLSYQSIRANYAAISHFYTMNDIILNRKKIIKFVNNIDERKKSRNQGYTSEQIHKLLDNCDERTKVIILIFVSTGIRLAALPLLRIGDLKLIKVMSDDGNDGSETYEITVYQGYREEYVTYCTPECMKVINSYLDYRRRSVEVLTDSSPLIREQFDSNDPFKAKHPKSITVKTITKTLRQKMLQSGIRSVEHIGSSKGARLNNRKDVPLIHGFRKFFNTALMNADVHLIFKELLMGHSVKLDDFYYDQNSEKSRAKLLDEYRKALDALTINEENRLRHKVQELTEEDREIQSLREQIKSNESEMKEIKQVLDTMMRRLEFQDTLRETSESGKQTSTDKKKGN